MLASTVQFSNNDQPPVTAHFRRPTPGPALRKTSFPQDPTACPTSPALTPAFHAPKSSTNRASKPRMPNSQRSTHEQPVRDTRSHTGL